MLMKLICSAASSNQSHGDFPECRGQRQPVAEASLLVSPLVVAGIVIGLVLFLSCVTIIVGSLRKDGRLHNPQPAGYGPDGFSYGGSAGELRPACLDEVPPGFHFHSLGEGLERVGLYPDAPPRYEECVGPGATEIYVPADDPPPYSLLDPCQGEAGQGAGPDHARRHSTSTANSAGTSWFSAPRVASISYPAEEAPPYESVLTNSARALPLAPCDLYKHQTGAGRGPIRW